MPLIEYGKHTKTLSIAKSSLKFIKISKIKLYYFSNSGYI